MAEDWNSILEGLEELEKGLTDWEVNFVDDMRERLMLDREFTPKQESKLLQMYDERVLGARPDDY